MVVTDVVGEVMDLFKNGMQDVHCLDKVYELLQDESCDMTNVMGILRLALDKNMMERYPFKIVDFERVVETVSDEDEIHEFIAKANFLLENLVFFNLENIRVTPKETDTYFVDYIDVLHMAGVLEDTSYDSLRIHGANPKLDGLKFSNIELVSESEFEFNREYIDYGIFTPAGVFCVPCVLAAVLSYLFHFGIMFHNGTLNEEYDGKYIYNLLFGTCKVSDIPIKEFCQILIKALEEAFKEDEYIEYLKSIMNKLTDKV